MIKVMHFKTFHECIINFIVWNSVTLKYTENNFSLDYNVWLSLLKNYNQYIFYSNHTTVNLNNIHQLHGYLSILTRVGEQAYEWKYSSIMLEKVKNEKREKL